MAMRNAILRGAFGRLPSPVKKSIRETVQSLKPHLSYSWWIRHAEAKPDARELAKEVEAFRYKPTVSIVTPVYNTPIELLDRAIESVLGQVYANWELCLCDDLSTRAEVCERLEYWAKKDSRIKVLMSERNEGISGASNRALALATGEFVGFLDHDDELTFDALAEVVRMLQKNCEADIIYSDEDKLDTEGRRIQPYFKPDWSPEYMLSIMYVCHFSVYRRNLLEEIGGFREEVKAGPDYDVFLRASERARAVLHVPKILYHWRMAPNSIARSSDEKPDAFEAGRRAVSDHLQRKGIAAKVVHGNAPGFYRVRFCLDGNERVAIAVLESGAGDVERCAAAIEEKTNYRNREIIRVSAEPENGRPNLSRMINWGVAEANADYVVIMHDDIEPISREWIEAMLGFCRQKEIGAVGARLLYRTGELQHIGIVPGLNGVAGYPLRGLFSSRLGYPDPNHFVRNCSAVSAACMMVRKSTFEEVGGFDERLPRAYSDLDFCLKIREKGYRIVWTPEAEFYHDECEAANESDSEEVEYLKRRWGKALEIDPYYSPNLTVKYEDMGYRV